MTRHKMSISDSFCVAEEVRHKAVHGENPRNGAV